MKPLLEVQGIGKVYGTSAVLSDINLEIFPGEIIGLIGENGAGKSTLLKIISGVEKASSGVIKMDGKALHFSSMLDANQYGIGMVFQEQSLINNLSVAQNIFLNREKDFSVLGLTDWRRLHKAAKEALDKMGIGDIDVRKKVRDIDFATRQMIEIAKVFDIVSQNSERPALILLDEPTTVLSDAEIQRLFEHVRKMKEKGNTIIFISHRLSEIQEITDRIIVFKDGLKVCEMQTAEADEYSMYKKMVGRETTGKYYLEEKQVKASDEVVLELQNLAMLGSFKGVNLRLHKGEILGIAGVEGSGKEDLCAVICGDEAPSEGKFFVKGKEIRFHSPKHAKNKGVLSVPRDRRQEGIIGMLSIQDNICVSNLEKSKSGLLLSAKKQKAIAEQWIQDLRIKCTGTAQRIANLSGGNAQKVVFARVIHSDCEILILDHPTRGVDVGSKSEIYNLIREMASKGIAAILLGDTLDECIGLSSRVLVMKDGQINGEFLCNVNDKPSQVEVVQKMM